ncbi:hypothetical protein J6590_067765 [Homalodisca vitripennis]|nr:hypothetical protein J6590_067765 [Homalodisca vitripennis]
MECYNNDSPSARWGLRPQAPFRRYKSGRDRGKGLGGQCHCHASVRGGSPSLHRDRERLRDRKNRSTGMCYLPRSPVTVTFLKSEENNQVTPGT